MTHASPRPATRTARSLVRLVLASLVLVTAVAVVGPVAHPETANAATGDYMEDLLVTWINDARHDRGLPALKVGWRLEDMAGDRAATMASTGQLAHTSCLSCALRSRSVEFKSCGEVIAYTTYPWGYDAARQIFLGWKRSSGHWGLLMSRSFTRFGIGVAYRSKAGTTYAAGVLAG